MRILRTLFLARRNLALVLPHMRDARVPNHLKLAAVALALLVFTPLNVLGYIPVVGFFDDAALLMFIASWFVAASTRHVEKNVSLATIQ